MDEIYINCLADDQALKTLHKFLVSVFNHEGRAIVSANTYGDEKILECLGIDTDHGYIKIQASVVNGAPVLEIAVEADVDDSTQEEE